MNRRARMLLVPLTLLAGWFATCAIASAADDFYPSFTLFGKDIFDVSEENCGPGLYGVKETMFWGRTVGSGRVAVIRVTDEANAAPSTPVFAMTDLAMNFQPGMRIVAGWRQDSQRAFEVSYFGIFNWHDSATVQGNNNLALPGDLGLASQDFFAADEMRLTYRSQLNNAETNVIRTDGNFSLLGGFRYLSLYEKFNIRATDLDAGAG